MMRPAGFVRSLLIATAAGFLAVSMVVVRGWGVIGKFELHPDARQVYMATKAATSGAPSIQAGLFGRPLRPLGTPVLMASWTPDRAGDLLRTGVDPISRRSARSPPGA